MDALKKPNTYRKYEAVLDRFASHFKARQFESITTDELNDFVVPFKKKSGMESNTVLHNVVIIAQFFKRSGRGGIMRQLHLPGTLHGAACGIHGRGTCEVLRRL